MFINGRPWIPQVENVWFKNCQHWPKDAEFGHMEEAICRYLQAISGHLQNTYTFQHTFAIQEWCNFAHARVALWESFGRHRDRYSAKP